MKKYFFVMAAFTMLLGFSACGNSNKKAAETAEVATAPAVDASNAVYVEDLLQTAEANVGKDVTLKGFITHTCKHSGRRCFVVGKDQKTSLRIEAKGNIGGFNRELIGSEVVIKGVLRENRLTKEYIDQAEEELKEKQGKEEGNGETCNAEMNNIQNMRAWMKANNKDYYSIYYVDGTDYEVVE